MANDVKIVRILSLFRFTSSQTIQFLSKQLFPFRSVSSVNNIVKTCFSRFLEFIQFESELQTHSIIIKTKWRRILTTWNFLTTHSFIQCLLHWTGFSSAINNVTAKKNVYRFLLCSVLFHEKPNEVIVCFLYNNTNN